MTTTPVRALVPAQAADPRADYGLPPDVVDRELEQVARLAAAVCGVPTATVNLLDDVEQHQVATCGLVGCTSPRADAMCDVTLREDRPVVVEDASRDPRFCDNPWVDGRLAAVRFYASYQLRNGLQRSVGTMCAFDTVPHRLTDQQTQALSDLADQTARLLEQRREARLLREQLVELDRTNTELAAFAGRVAHDLRNPLTGIVGFLQLAQRRGGDVPPLVSTCLTQASVAAERVQQMLDGLLRFATSGIPASAVDVDLAELVEQVRGDLGHCLAEADARVEVGRLGTLRTDPLLLGQVLQNLLSNACKYRQQGRASVVRVERQPAAGGCTLVVADNGRGIPAEARGRVFELFRRAPNAGDVEGSGIGLATCARSVEALGGSIELDDTPGGGLTVRVTLPER